MADTKISALTALTGANVDAAADFLVIVDTSVTTTKKILVSELLAGQPTTTVFAGATTLLTIGGTGATSVVAIPGTLEATNSTTASVTIAGGLAVAKRLAVGTGAAVGGATPGAGGVAFPATAVAVADVNTLDDYEEGTWDATVTSSGGSITTDTTANQMNYTKVGRAVTIAGEVTVSSVSSPTTNLTITGLPFTNQAGTENSARTAIALSCGTLEATAATVMQGYILPSATAISIEHFAAGVAAAAAADVKAGSTFKIGGTYFV